MEESVQLLFTLSVADYRVISDKIKWRLVTEVIS